MSKEKFLVIAVVFLLVLNGGVIVYLVMGRNVPPGPPQLFELITKRLDFDKTQQEQFFTLRDQHRASMDKLDKDFEVTVRNYFQLLLEEIPSAESKDSLENVMAFIEKEKASTTLQHFRSVKELCSEEQKNEFDALLPELVQILMPPKNNQPPRRH